MWWASAPVHDISLQWTTMERRMPVVYYGTESGSYSYVKTVTNLASY